MRLNLTPLFGTALLTLGVAQDAAHTDLAKHDDVVQSSLVIAIGGPVVQATRAVDLAICLDTSGSMSGLIEATKQKLWSIVNDMALAEPEPVLRVALLTFGNDGHNPENGWVKVDVPLTADLDLISQHLFALSTNGGSEYVSRVVDKATHGLEWSPDPMALKLIVVAGNEGADQDPMIPYPQACKSAITAGVMINAIYCGNKTDAVARGWEQVAKLADGHFATIDHNQGTIIVESPFDDQLGALSSSVNATYIPLGDVGRSGWANQVLQDENAEGLNRENVASRARTKGGKLYKKSWDLVEMCDAEEFDWTTLKDEDLPEEMRELDIEGRKAYVAKKKSERAEIHKQIADLSQRRQAWTEAYIKLHGLDASKSFDQALRGAMRSQAASKGFQFAETELKAPSTLDVEALRKHMEELAKDLPPVQQAPNAAGTQQ
ncbi:MAG: VWA domain-containing protein, partial [Planctomycetota bacterium]|nr:VWA domain-containing protein [Planctomycetota bacterium]